MPSFEPGRTIPVKSFEGHNWYNANAAALAERWENEAGEKTWRGNWLQATHRYLPFQVLVTGRRYNGWIELSADTDAEELTLHRRAIAASPERAIKAGL